MSDPRPEQEIHLNEPHGGVLKYNVLEGAELDQLKKASADYANYTLKDRQICDLELILNGGFSPLEGFLVEEDYKEVVENCRLKSGAVWPMPIYLDVTEEQAKTINVGQKLNLRDKEGDLIAVLDVESKYIPDKAKEAEKVLGSPDDTCHPSIDYLLNEAGQVYLGGKVQGAQLPTHYDYGLLRMGPRELRQKIKDLNWTRAVGFQTRNPMHRSHRELTLMAARDANANVIVNPVVGMTKPGDVDHYTRVRVYKEIMKHYPEGMAILSLLPLAMRMAGPREALWHAIIRKNHGCTHFIVGRDHAGPGKNRDGKDFYGAYDAQELVAQHADEVGIIMLKYQHVVYVEELAEYRTLDNVPEGARVLSISGTELRRRLYKGLEIPEWFTFPSVVSILRETYPPREKQGFTIFFTGLSGAGKSTIANALRVRLLEMGGRPVSLLDGDEVRTHLSTELGFSKEHRDLNIKRIGFVASTITKSRGIAIIAAIAPYREPRDYVRRYVSNTGGFVEVHVSTSLEVCEQRDRKGLYARARKGIIKGFTGIDDPYEEPTNPELNIDTKTTSVPQAVNDIIRHLEVEGYITRHVRGDE